MQDSDVGCGNFLLPSLKKNAVCDGLNECFHNIGRGDVRKKIKDNFLTCLVKDPVGLGRRWNRSGTGSKHKENRWKGRAVENVNGVAMELKGH